MSKSKATLPPRLPPSPAEVKAAFWAEKLENKSHYFFLALLNGIFILMLIIVNPVGDFPLNDDWIFAQPVNSLITTGNYGAETWSSPILILQVFWGLLFCIFTGFSFTALRISTLILGMAAVSVLYLVIFILSKSKRFSFLAAILLLVNPIFFCLANTFMTDVPFIAMALFSIYFFFRFLDAGKNKFLIAATLFSVAATLIRQFGVVIPLAYSITAFLKFKQPVEKRIRHFIPFFVTLVAYKAALMWLKHTGTEIFGLPTDSFPTLTSSFFTYPEHWLEEIATRLGNIIFYFGLFFLPLLLIVKSDFTLLLKPFWLKIISSVILLAAVASFILFYREFPIRNVLSRGYIGPKTLDVYDYSRIDFHEHTTFFSNKLIIFYIIGIFGAALLIINLLTLFAKKRAIPAPSVTKHFFIGLCLTGYTVLILVPFATFDRYLVPAFLFLPMIIITGMHDLRLIKPSLYIFISFYVFFIFLFSALGTHDYLAWNRARMKAAYYLTKDKNIPLSKIDAGYETNGWLFGYGRKFQNLKYFGGLIEGNEYSLTFGDADGYQPINKFPYTNYLPPGQRYIYVMHATGNILTEGYNLLQQGKLDSALLFFNNTGQGQAYRTQKENAYFQLGLKYFQIREADKAIRCFDSVSAINPANADAFNNLGACYMNFKHDSRKAQAYFIKSVEINPALTQSYIYILLCAGNNKDDDSFIKYAKLLLDKGMTINEIEAKGITIPDKIMKKIK